MLTRLLRKRYRYEAELIDPRGWSLKGVPVRVEAFDPSMADYYDLIVGLHPDEALHSVVEAAERTATLVVPCCNFWSAGTKLGRDELIEEIADFHELRGGKSEHIALDFLGPKNHALILLPPAGSKLQAQQEVVRVVFIARVQDIAGGDLQGVILGARHRAPGSHLVTAGGPALPCGVLLKGGSRAAAAPPRIDSEGLDVAFPERLTVAQHRGPARLGADHLDQVAQEADAPGAVKGAEHVRLPGVREPRCQVAILGQHPGRDGDRLLEVRRPWPDLAHLCHGLGVTVIHPAIMPPATPGMTAAALPGDAK